MDSCNSLESINSSDNCPDSFEVNQPVVTAVKETKVTNQVKLLWSYTYDLYKNKKITILTLKQFFLNKNNSFFYETEMIIKQFKWLKSFLNIKGTASTVFINYM